MIVKRDYRIPSLQNGLQLLLRNKRLIDEDQRLPGMTVLFVHGATYGSSDTFDYKIEEMSWMDQLAGLGFDAWCLDLLGYGRSDRPADTSIADSSDSLEPIVICCFGLWKLSHDESIDDQIGR